MPGRHLGLQRPQWDLGFRAAYRDYCQLSLNGHTDLGNSLPLSSELICKGRTVTPVGGLQTHLPTSSRFSFP